MTGPPAERRRRWNRWRGDDDAVRAERVHLHIVHADGQFDHLAPVGAFQCDVVQRPILNGLWWRQAARRPHGRSCVRRSNSRGGDPADRLNRSGSFQFGGKPACLVHAENRRGCSGRVRRRAVSLPSPPERRFRCRPTPRGGCTPKSGGLGVVDGDFETGHFHQLALRLGHYGSGLPGHSMRHHHRVALGHGILLSIRSHCSLF